MLDALPSDIPTWESIDENYWEHYLPTDFCHKEFRIIRVRIDSSYYDDVVKLRFQGMLESGYINKSSLNHKTMELERDQDSVILAMIYKQSVIATLTLNTPTQKFPKLAATMEKGFEADSVYFNHPQSLEFVKMVFNKSARAVRYGINMFLIACIISRALDKYNFWHISRVNDVAMGFMSKFGFDFYLDKIFIDKSLNNTKSCLGYCSLYSLPYNEEMPSNIRHAIFKILNSNYKEVTSSQNEKRLYKIR